MSLVLNTNVASMVAQNSLTTSGTQLASSLQQLSSGLRVNTAADDAAGYAIAQGMTSQINGLNQAARNANDGVSLTQTASGAMTEIVNDLQTMRDLAVESLNATNSANDRADLNAQFSQLAADINNVAANTQFNGVNLLDGSFQGADFQIGANAGQIISVASIASTATSAIGNYYTTAATSGAYADTTADAGKTASFDIALTNTAGTTLPTITTGAITLTGNQTTDLNNVASAINESLGSSQGIVATVDAVAGSISLSTATGDAQTVAITLNAASTTGSSVGGLGMDASYALGSAGGTAQNLSNTSVTSVDSSNLVLVSIDNALQQMATASAALGAYQNRFQAAISGLNTNATNLSNAKSQIVDTDYAASTSALSKAQILQQAGTAMVAQANTIPQNIMTLLQKLP
jgi:flagellin